MKQQQSKTAQRLTVPAVSLVVAVVLSACGGGGGGETSSTMMLGQSYEVGENTSMVATSIPPPVIEVVHDFDTNIRHVTLLSGTAELYGDYVLMP